MRPKLFILALTTGLCAVCIGCASTGPPLPPSLELPKPPNDLRATRRGDRVSLVWTVPSQTTDRQSVRYLGPARICRGVGVPLTQCEPPVGEAPKLQADILTLQAEGKKVPQEYVDLLPSALMKANPLAMATVRGRGLQPGSSWWRNLKPGSSPARTHLFTAHRSRSSTHGGWHSSDLGRGCGKLRRTED
jgi:hypothetical protein